MFMNALTCLLVTVFATHSVYTILLVPERAETTYVNKKYFANATLNVRRSSRRGEYVFNMIGMINVPVGNYASVHIMLYEHRAKYNQYFRSFIEFHFKLCDMIHKDPFFGAALRRQGITECPVQPGLVEWKNLTLVGDLKFEIPFQKGKAEIKLRNDTAGELMASGELYFHCESKSKKSNK